MECGDGDGDGVEVAKAVKWGGCEGGEGVAGGCCGRDAPVEALFHCVRSGSSVGCRW